MKTILITGGANGIGKGIAMYYLEQGHQVIAVGSSIANGDAFLNQAKQVGAEKRAFYIQADLSLLEENKRIVDDIKNHFPIVDTLILCAAKHNKEYVETSEGYESTFALAYLSRFVISYGLKDCLEKSDDPVILNICGTGMKGDVNWNDLQHKNTFDAMKVMMHGSRLNDLLGVAFVQNDKAGKIKYILYNPMAVQTPGMKNSSTLLMRFIYKIIGKTIEKAIIPITELLNNLPLSTLSAFRENKELSLDSATFSKENATRLYEITTAILSK